MTVLDDLSGFEFEDVMEEVFRKLGYENVRQADRVADKGRDILMEETVDGQRRTVIVECKHTDSVGRPVVQKLHSAVATYEYDGPKRGMVATTGRFTGPATEYTAQLQANGDPYPIELLDGDDLRTVADDIGLDLYNGRIEILCDETLRPYDPTRDTDAAVRDAFGDVENIDPSEIPSPELWADFEPFVLVRAHVDATFETTVGVVHQVHEHDRLVLRAVRDGPERSERSLSGIITANLDQRIELDENECETLFDQYSIQRFGQTETEYREWAVERMQRTHTTTVQYTGDNNVTYTKECEPNQSDITVRSVTPVYVPRIRGSVDIGEYTYPYEYYAAGPSRQTIDDGIHRCQQCGDSSDSAYTYCANCDSINCTDHIKTERLVHEPVCTGCAITEPFFFRTKYFYSESNLERFREEYESMPVHQKALENKPLLASIVLTAIVSLFVLLSTAGIV